MIQVSGSWEDMGRCRVAGIIFCLKYLSHVWCNLTHVLCQEYDEAALYTQLKYFETLFDIPRLLAKKSLSAQSLPLKCVRSILVLSSD